MRLWMTNNMVRGCDTPDEEIESLANLYGEQLRQPQDVQKFIDLLHMGQDLETLGICKINYKVVTTVEGEIVDHKKLVTFNDTSLSSLKELVAKKPKYLEFIHDLIKRDLLHDSDEHKLLKWVFEEPIKKKRGPKNKTYGRSWVVYRMMRTLIDDYKMPAYSNNDEALSQNYAANFLYNKLQELGYSNIKENDIKNDFRKFNRIGFLKNDSD
jgi:hypothetical protein